MFKQLHYISRLSIYSGARRRGRAARSRKPRPTTGVGGWERKATVEVGEGAMGPCSLAQSNKCLALALRNTLQFEGCLSGRAQRQ